MIEGPNRDNRALWLVGLLPAILGLLLALALACAVGWLLRGVAR